MILNAALPYFLAAALVATGVAYVKGRNDGKEIQSAKCLRDEQIAAKAADSAASAAAAAITRIKVENKTIQQRVEREIQTRIEYRDCRHPAGVLSDINEAITGRRTDTPADRVLPSADAAFR